MVLDTCINQSAFSIEFVYTKMASQAHGHQGVRPVWSQCLKFLDKEVLFQRLVLSRLMVLLLMWLLL